VEKTNQLLGKDIYESAFVKNLFNDMSKSYDRVNYITSFGFSKRWRRQFVNEIPLGKGDVVADLLTGMGECWEFALKKIGPSGKIIALDFSEGMIRYAHERKQKISAENIEILCEDIFNCSIAENSVCAVICGFGIKTFSNDQLEKLANEINRILKPGGCISMIDISIPHTFIFRKLYMFYLKRAIPILGLLFLGRPETYAMLGKYTESFKNSQNVLSIFESKGFKLNYLRYYYGCATGIKGIKL
jgi:demethylmenaquinone methyltransferase/2-methoxy-6-polyprenyl-1,4-benzoquinol methylase